MDGPVFDDLSRAVARAGTRRALLKGAIVGLAGSLAGRVRAVSAARVRNQPNGTPCSVATECASFFCIDGFCCDSPCSGQCEACNVPGLEGTCAAVEGAPVGARGPCAGEGICGAVCDGVTREMCVFPGTNVTCAPVDCDGAGWQNTYACGGNGTCAPTTTACPPDDVCREGTGCQCTAPGRRCGEDPACCHCSDTRQGRACINFDCSPPFCGDFQSCSAENPSCPFGYVCTVRACADGSDLCIPLCNVDRDTEASPAVTSSFGAAEAGTGSAVKLLP
jgi:hypothetical protein